MAHEAEGRGLIGVCKQVYRHGTQVTGAWIDTQATEDSNTTCRDNDLSYWSELGECYEPEWFPLGVKLPSVA